MTADWVVEHADVWTMDPERPRAEAIAVAGGRVVYVGDQAGLAAWVGPDTERTDAAGAVVLPGFVDAHLHPAEGGVELGQCGLGDATDLDGALAAVRACDDGGRGWLVGGGWSLAAFPDARPPDGALDAAFPDRPVFLWAEDGHSAWANAVALRRAGVRADTPDPPGGRFERDPSGAPSGVLRESAAERVAERVPRTTGAEWRAGVARAVAHANAHGITGLFEAAGRDRGALRAYRALDRRGELHATVTVAIEVDGPGDVARAVRWRRRFASDHVAPIAAKIFVDGVIEARTAAMLAPYLDTGTSGEPLWTDAALRQTVGALAAAGFDVHLHAIGDRAVRQALDAVEAAPRGPRFGIAHLECVDPADAPRFAALGVSAVFSPLWAYADDYVVDLTWPGLGPQRSAGLYPIGDLAAAGAPLAFGSDWTVSSLDPLQGIEVAVTRRDPDGDGVGDPLGDDLPLSVEAAVAAYTRGAAHAAHQPGGVIRVGAPADLIALTADPRDLPSSRIGDIEVGWTRVRGVEVSPR
ncbi:MAG: amidohydrolase [Myxococcota bacterium]